jgi:hypothetical protein
MTNAGQAVSFFNERPRNGYMQRWSASVQRQMPSRFVWEVTYVGNRGTKLEVSNPLNALPVQYLSRSAERDQATINYLAAQFPNPFYPLLAGTGLAGTNVGRSQLLTPYPHFTGLSAAMPLGYSWYHSLQSTLERRLSGGVSLQANYTWAKYMDAGSFLNPGEPKLEELIAAEDRQHRFTATGIWELPFGRGRRLLGSARGAVDQLVNGWSLQAVWQANTGAPLGFGNALFIGDVRDIALAKSERTLSRWFNTSGFVRDASRQVASNYRTFSNRFSGVRGPGMNLWDISLIKRVRISERVKLQIRGEFLNATNRTHFGAPTTGPTSTLFGQITASSGYPRQLHLGLRLEF